MTDQSSWFWFNDTVPELEDNPETWDEAQVEQILRERQTIKQRLEETDARFKQEVSRIQTRLKEITESDKERVIHLDAALLNYHDATGQKTVSYPSGTVTVTTSQPKCVYQDEETAIEWCQENYPTALKQRVLVSEIKKAVKDQDIVTTDGEAIMLNATPFTMTDGAKTIRVTT